MLLITNNPKVKKCLTSVPMDYHDVDYGEVLDIVKDHIINQKSILLTHPLSGSIKPNETYYKSIVLDDGEHDSIDLESLEMMESAIEVYEKFMKNKMRPNWTEKVLEDFAYVDYYIMRSTFECMHLPV